jgi:hypothetical protein
MGNKTPLRVSRLTLYQLTKPAGEHLITYPAAPQILLA